MPWWKKDQPAAAGEPEPDPQDDEPQWPVYQDDDEEEDEEPAQGAGDGDQTRLEAAMQERAEYLRQKFAEKGIDIAEDGEPVIRDPKRFRSWASPAVGAAAQERRAAVESQPQQPAQPPAAQPPAPQPGEPKEIWELTQADLDRMIEEKAKQIAQPWLDQMQQQRNLIGKRWVDDATQKAHDALAQVAPDYLHILDHPDFEATYKQQLSMLNPEYLDSPQVLASTALGLVAWLDPEQMPDRKQPLDDRAARAAVNRSLVPNSRPAIDQSSTASATGRGAEQYSTMSRWLAEKRIGRISPEDLMALDAVDEYGMHTIEAYTKAQKKIAKARGK